MFQNNPFYMQPATNQVNRFFLLFFFSAAALAGANGNIQLPGTYRTPLSDMTYDNHKEWRSEPEDKNPWREDEEQIVEPRIKVELFPQYNYDSLYYSDSTRDPNSSTIFDDETERERPVSNILQYSF